MSDEAARQRIRDGLGESLLVEAAAGTGKTTVLIERLVRVLATGRGSVGSVVAVTFTRKAAGELKLRLREALDRARQEAEEPGERGNLERAIASLEEARIGTIHSFCAELLRERPVEAGIDPSFVEVADDEAQRIFGRAFDRFVQAKLDEMPPGLRRSLNRLAVERSYFGDTPLDRLRAAAWELVDWRDFPAPWGRRPFEREGEIDRLVEELDRLAELAVRGENQRDPLRRGLEPALFLFAWIRRAEKASPDAARDYDAIEARLLELGRQLKRSPKKGYGKYAEALPREQVVGARVHFLELLDEFKRRADADLAALLHGELREVVERYEELKRAAGKLDFLDLLLRTRDMLRGNASVRQHLQSRFTHVFVDEFQDTDPLQAEVLLLLASADPAESDWRRVRPVPGKLFLVGDPKQSIYRFRRADVEMYEAVKSGLAARGVVVLHLSRSFRAVAPIQRLVNRAFATEMTGDTHAGSCDYIALEERRRAHPGQVSVVALPPPRPYGQWSVTAQAIEDCMPEVVAGFVAWLLRQERLTVENPEQEDERIRIAPHHVCILFRRYQSFGQDVTRAYTRALEARGVPHLLIGARTFHQREEVETIRTALTAIEWPDDELSVYATLRGSLFAIADTALLRFHGQHGQLHPFRRPDTVDPELEPVVQVLAQLERLHRQRNSRAMVETLQELLSFARAHAAFALRPAGHQVLLNLERICDMARSYELAGGLSFRGFVERLDAASERPGSGQTPVAEEGAEGVRLMTVHNAKGLEFPVVVLADMTARLTTREPDRTLQPDRGLCAMKLLGCSPWELLDNGELEQRRDEAEGVRVAYVAATRARDMLVVPAVGDGPRDGWLRPLNKAIYPSRERWRQSRPPAGAPPFGEATVLERPQEYDGRPEGSVRPGLHHFEDGSYDVVWWDPATLALDSEWNPGFGLDEILSEDDGGDVARQNLLKYQDWRERRAQTVREGAEPQFAVLPVTELSAPPPGPARALHFERCGNGGARPAGKRFGTLVHTVLRDVALDGSRSHVQELAVLQGRLLDATAAEVEAAAEAVAVALRHPLLERARRAGQESGGLYREAELLVPLGDERLLEGTLDLAFREGSAWIVVDFKTDADLGARREEYECQLAWYLFGLERLTGQQATGYLLQV